MRKLLRQVNRSNIMMNRDVTAASLQTKELVGKGDTLEHSNLRFVRQFVNFKVGQLVSFA